MKAAARELRQLLPSLARQLESFECLCCILVDAIDEHREVKTLLQIPEAVFARVEKNLKTSLSAARCVKEKLKSRLRMVDTCLSTV